MYVGNFNVLVDLVEPNLRKLLSFSERTSDVILTVVHYLEKLAKVKRWIARNPYILGLGGLRCGFAFLCSAPLSEDLAVSFCCILFYFSFCHLAQPSSYLGVLFNFAEYLLL